MNNNNDAHESGIIANAANWKDFEFTVTMDKDQSKKILGLTANDDDIIRKGKIRSCKLCLHKKVCVMWSLFKASIENKSPQVESPKDSGILRPLIESDDLAKICRAYDEAP